TSDLRGEGDVLIWFLLSVPRSWQAICDRMASWSPMDATPRFLVDGMLIRLGKYLRCLGYDAEWEHGAGTRALARRAAAEERLLLTRNLRLGTEIPAPPGAVVLSSDEPVAALRELARALDLDLATG